MNSVKVDIKPGTEVSRVEVIVRLVLMFVYGIIASVFGFIAGIIIFINFFTCLLLAKRVAVDFVVKYLKWVTMLYTYLYYVTDERPPWTP